VQVLVDYSIAYQPYASISLESPAGTSIYLRYGFTSYPTYTANINCIFADDGSSQSSADMNCGDCRFVPSDTSVSLSDFTEDSPEGDWVLSATSYYGGSAFYNSTLNEWCLHLYQGCELERPANMTVDYGKTAFDAVLEWEIPDGTTYDSVLINRNGVQIAELDGDATSYTDEGISGVKTYVVVGYDDELGCGRPSFSAMITLGVDWFCAADPDDDDTSDRVSISGYGLGFVDFDYQNEELEGCSDKIDEDAGDDPDMVRINDLQFRVAGNSTTGYSMYHWSYLFSPAGTSVRMGYMSWTGGYSYYGGSDFDVVYSDQGSATYYVRTGLQKPYGPGTMSDFAGEDARGEWTFAAATYYYDVYFDGLCLGVFADPCTGPAGLVFKRGDADNNGSVNALLDANFLLGWGFGGGTAPTCRAQADADGNGGVNALLDANYLLGWGFGGGSAPPAPGTTCGLANDTYTLDDECEQDDINGCSP